MRIAILPGDGIGPEVIGRAISEVPSGTEMEWIDASADRYLHTGDVLTPEDLRRISRSDALLLGAVGDPRVPDGVLERGILLTLRQVLDLYVNVRPFPELDLVFVRENTEGLYCGRGRRGSGTAEEISVNTTSAIERCATFAFELAAKRRRCVTLVHKTNVLVHAGALWKEVVEQEAANHPEIELVYEHVDAAAYHLVRDPARFDVVLTDNMFGDILSDLAAGLAGGLGKATGANLHPDPTTRPTRCIGLFEPIHGSAPDIAGTGTADATAAIEAARLMVQSLREEKAMMS